MPKLPARQSKQSKLLQELQSQSILYSQKATLLSKLLEQAEQFLRQMPGKIAIRTESSNSSYDLGFAKEGGIWRLELWRFEDDGMNSKIIPVTQANILQKATAATLLPELYERLKSTFTQGQAEIDRGLESLKDLPFLDFDEFTATDEDAIKKEGADDGIPF
jgi:hypothetical protein